MAIPVDALIRARTQKAGPYENCTALYHLLQTKQGRSVLKSIFSLNPQLAKDIPVSAWKLKVVNTDDAEKVSPVELLSPYWSEFKELLPSSVQKEVVAKRYGFFVLSCYRWGSTFSIRGLGIQSNVVEITIKTIRSQ